MNDAAVFKLVAALKRIVAGREVKFPDGHTEMVEHGDPVSMVEAALDEFAGGEPAAERMVSVLARSAENAVDIAQMFGPSRIVAIVPGVEHGAPLGAVWIYLWGVEGEKFYSEGIDEPLRIVNAKLQFEG